MQITITKVGAHGVVRFETEDGARFQADVTPSGDVRNIQRYMNLPGTRSHFRRINTNTKQWAQMADALQAALEERHHEECLAEAAQDGQVFVTENEWNLLQDIAWDQMNSSNGQEPQSYDEVHCYIWADERAANIGLTEQQVGGLLTSLQGKGLIWVQTDDADGNLGFTEQGFEFWQTEYRARIEQAKAADEPAIEYLQPVQERKVEIATVATEADIVADIAARRELFDDFTAKQQWGKGSELASEIAELHKLLPGALWRHVNRWQQVAAGLQALAEIRVDD